MAKLDKVTVDLRTKPQIYLAGPMPMPDTWRAEAKDRLEDLGLKAVQPELLADYCTRFGVSKEQAGQILTERDRKFASESEYVLVNFTGSTSRSMGTCVELGWADNGFTTTVVINPPDQPHYWHPIIRNTSDYTVETLDEALDIIEALTWRNS